MTGPGAARAARRALGKIIGSGPDPRSSDCLGASRTCYSHLQGDRRRRLPGAALAGPWWRDGVGWVRTGRFRVAAVAGAGCSRPLLAPAACVGGLRTRLACAARGRGLRTWLAYVACPHGSRRQLGLAARGSRLAARGSHAWPAPGAFARAVRPRLAPASRTRGSRVRRASTARARDVDGGRRTRPPPAPAVCRHQWKSRLRVTSPCSIGVWSTSVRAIRWRTSPSRCQMP